MSKRILISLFLAFITLVAFTVCDYLLLNDIIPNRGPRATAYDLLKTACALGLAVAIVGSVLADGATSGQRQPMPAPRLGLASLSLPLAVGFTLLFLASPRGFYWLSLEDNVVEYLSAGFCLAGSVFFVGIFLTARHWPAGTPRRYIALTLAALGAVALFLIGMEEVSWFQRILGFSTPESFAGNRQGEVNLHNFFTTPVHSVYRTGTWAVLMLVPFMVYFGPRSRLFDALQDFVPTPSIVALAAPIACFNYNTWPFMPTQVVAFTSLMILVLFGLRSLREGQREAALLFGGAVLLMIVVQPIYLLGGERYVRHWDVTEYQEFFMALGLAAAAWNAREQVRARAGTSAAPLVMDAARTRS